MEIWEENQPALWLQIFLEEFILIIIKIYLFRVEERLVLFDSGKLWTSFFGVGNRELEIFVNR